MAARIPREDQAYEDEYQGKLWGRERAPLTRALADRLFDLAREFKNSDVETEAIQVDASAQDGIEATPQQVAAVAARVNRLLDFPTTCQAKIGPAALCSLGTLPGSSLCIHHQERGK